MAEKSKAQGNTQANSSFPDNNSRQISPADIRNNAKDLWDSTWNKVDNPDIQSDLTDYGNRISALEESGAIAEVYADIAALLADQGNQVEDAVYEVTDASTDTTVDSGKSWYRKTSATTGAIGDYIKVSEEEAFSENLAASDISNDSTATGSTVKDALDDHETRISAFEEVHTVSTTDNTATTIHAFPTESDKVYQFDIVVNGIRTGGTAGTAGDSGSYRSIAVFKNIGGTVSQIGSTLPVLVRHDQVWAVDFNINGTDVEVQVTGAVDNNIDWELMVK